MIVFPVSGELTARTLVAEATAVIEVAAHSVTAAAVLPLGRVGSPGGLPRELLCALLLPRFYTCILDR